MLHGAGADTTAVSGGDPARAGRSQKRITEIEPVKRGEGGGAGVVLMFVFCFSLSKSFLIGIN